MEDIEKEYKEGDRIYFRKGAKTVYGRNLYGEEVIFHSMWMDNKVVVNIGSDREYLGEIDDIIDKPEDEFKVYW